MGDYAVRLWVSGTRFEFDTETARDDTFKQIRSYLEQKGATTEDYRLVKLDQQKLYDDTGNLIKTEDVIVEDTREETA